jgi:hypothetical protein
MKKILLTLCAGLVLGGGLGLYIGWFVSPIQLTNVTPSTLNEAEQEEYVRLVAAAYWRDDNLATARQRLAHLGREDLIDWLRETAVDTVLQSQSELEIRQIVYLASSIGLDSPAFAPYLPAKPVEASDDS